MHSGSCLCGSINYEIQSDLNAIVHCHCRYCRKAHGAAFTTVLFMAFSGLAITQGADLLERYRIRNLNSDRCFCRQCGTRLFNHQPSSGMISIVVATLDVDVALRPVAHFNTESKCSWFEIKDALPQYLSTPEPAELRKMLSN